MRARLGRVRALRHRIFPPSGAAPHPTFGPSASLERSFTARPPVEQTCRRAARDKIMAYARRGSSTNRFLLTATGTNRIVANNDLRSFCPVVRCGLRCLHLLRVLHLRVSELRPVLTRLSD